MDLHLFEEVICTACMQVTVSDEMGNNVKMIKHALCKIDEKFVRVLKIYPKCSYCCGNALATNSTSVMNRPEQIYLYLSKIYSKHIYLI